MSLKSSSFRICVPFRDLTVALIVGLSSGTLCIPIVINMRLRLPLKLALLPPVFAVLCAAVLQTGRLTSHLVASLYRFTKFGLVGALNSSIDFGILNLFMLMSGIASGGAFLVFKVLSATLAVVNSYLWNKYWTFEAGPSRRRAFAELFAFSIVSSFGIVINVGATHLLVNVVGAPSSVDAKVWANAAALSAAVVTLFVNFIGYKMFVFEDLVDSTVHTQSS